MYQISTKDKCCKYTGKKNKNKNKNNKKKTTTNFAFPLAGTAGDILTFHHRL